MTEKQSDMENKIPSPHFTPPADFFGREMERSRELPPRIEHVESYIDACLGRWKTLYPSPKKVNDEARQVGTDVLKTALRKMSEIAERAQKTFLEKGKSPDACREYYVEVSELIDVARDLADWEKTDLRSEIVLLHIDKWKAMRREAHTALEVQGEDLDLDAFYADDEERLPPTWRDSLCYSMPLLLFGALLFFFGRFAGAKVPAGATDVWAQWVGLRPTMGIWVVVPAVLLFSCALFFLLYGVKQLFQGPKPSLLDILKLWAAHRLFRLWCRENALHRQRIFRPGAAEQLRPGDDGRDVVDDFPHGLQPDHLRGDAVGGYDCAVHLCVENDASASPRETGRKAISIRSWLKENAKKIPPCGGC